MESYAERNCCSISYVCLKHPKTAGYTVRIISLPLGQITLVSWELNAIMTLRNYEITELSGYV